MNQKLFFFVALFCLGGGVQAQIGVPTDIVGNDNATLANGVDDYISFQLNPTPPVAFYEAPFTYTMTATQGGLPVAVTLINGSAATAIRYGIKQPFRLAGGTAGNGNVIITVTPNWGGGVAPYIPVNYSIPDPGNAVITPCAGGVGPKTVTYKYNSVFGATEYSNTPTLIPKFDVAGGKTLLQIDVTYSATVQTTLFVESSSSIGVNYRAIGKSDVFFDYPTTGTTVATASLTGAKSTGYPALSALPAGISVPASGTWAGDFSFGASAPVLSTLNRMLYAPGAWLSESAFSNQNFLSDPRWVTNATGVATDDDDIDFFQGLDTYSPPTTTYTSAADIANFVGSSGYVPITYSTLSSFTLTGGGGAISTSQVTKTRFTVTITYTYTETCASLGNRVWLDNNNDGLQTAGEPGVAGVAVSLYKGTTLVASTTTDAYGMYLFTGLAAGTDYSVKVTPPANYSFTTQGTGGASGAGSATDCDVNAGGTSPQITVVAGTSQLDVDAGLVFKNPTVSSIGDRVWFDANANGDQDATEAGVAGVTVTLLKETTTGSGVYVPYLSTTTDGDGMYLFNNLPNNTNYKVAVTPLPNTKLTSSTGTTPGNATTNSDVNATTGLSAAINIPAAGAAIRGIDAGLIEDVKSSLGDRVWNDVNNNGIQDAGEQGVPNVTMTLLKETAPGSGTYTSVGTTMTDATGKYLFTGLDAANYKVTATLPTGYSVSPMNAAGGTEYNNSDFSTTGTPTSGVYALAANQDYAGVDMGIHNNTAGLGSIGDRVWSDKNNNGVQDAGEPGVAGISVRLLDGSNNPVNNPATGLPYVLVTDANGAYKFVDLPAGTYRVAFGNLPVNTQFSPTGAGTTSTDSDPNPATGITSNITLASGQNITTVDAGIAPFAPVGLASLGDRVWIDANNNGVQDAGEQGASGVTVTLYAADGTTVLKTTTTNAAGNYLFDGLNAGSYVVGFSGFPAGYALQTGKNDLGGNDLMDSDPNPTTGKTVVVNLATGEKNSSVDAGLYNTSATNSIGDYVWLDANNDGLQTSGEKAMPGVTVSLLDNTGKVISSVVTDNNGAYSFKNLPNGDYTVRISPPSGLSFTTPNVGGGLATNNSKFGTSGVSPVVSLTGGTNVTNIDAGLISTKALLGDRVWNDVNGNGIQDAGEPGVAGVTVTLYAANGTTVVSSAITDANGNYLFTNLDPASYVVGFTTIPAGMVFTTQDASGSTAANGSDVIVGTGKTAPVALAAGEVNLNVDAGLTPVLLGAISGVVWNDGVAGDNVRSASEPLIPGVTVTLKDGNGVVVGTTRTDGNGAYLFDKLPAGTGYTVTFSGYPAAATLVSQTTGTANGSDANQTTGVTPSITVVGGATTPNIDAGVTVYIPLPIDMLALTANVENCQVRLSWLNKEETNTKQYELLSSDNGAAFKVIGTTSVNKSANGTYQYLDTRSVNGNRIYRLRLTDLDGTISNSEAVKVTAECNGMTKISVYPNPATNTLSVDLSEVSGVVSYELLNSIGSQILRGSLSGGSIETINLSDIAQGAYLININVNGVIKGYKVQVVK